MLTSLKYFKYSKSVIKFIICLKNIKYIIDITRPVIKLNSKALFTAKMKDFFTFLPNENPTIPSVEYAYESKKKEAITTNCKRIEFNAR